MNNLHVFECPTEYSSFIEVAYGTLRAATRLDRLVEVCEDRIISTEDGYRWEVEITADTRKEAREALSLILKNFPIAIPEV